MGKQLCLNVTSDYGNKYSSPIPVIGLYIATSTLVCVVFIICDVFHGLYRKKPWIPCRFFSLNSLTLTLLAIASKLPVDLTTSMPSAQDQLSKLSGSVLICISMSFFSISLANQTDSERLSNMISLTIFVLTVVVNICIQIVTGVIFSFIIEHVIIMSCMLLLLAMMWYTCEFYIPWCSAHLTIGELKNINPSNSEEKSMIHRLKSVYLSSYEHNPELQFIDSLTCFSMCMLSTLCSLAMLQAALRSLVLKEVKFRCGVSDYKWSMWMVFVTQIIIILVGSIANVYRWFFSVKIFANIEIAKAKHVCCFGFPSSVLSMFSMLHIISFFKILRRGFMFIFPTIKRGVILALSIVTAFIAIWSSLVSCFLFYMPKLCFDALRNRGGATYIERKKWIQRNCEEDIEKWMQKDKRDSSTSHLIQLLSKTPPSPESLISKIPITSDKKASCLLVVVFVRIATIALPNTLSAPLIHTLEETFEIIYFIDKELNANRRKCAVAKELWMNRENNCHWLHRRFIRPSVKKFYARELKKSTNMGLQSETQLALRCALGIIEELKKAHDRIECYLIEDYELANNEISNIHEYITDEESGRACTSIDELYGHMEQLFVDMLHFFLSQAPIAIFKHIVESPTQEIEERTRCVIKFLCKLEQFEDKVHWAFPNETGITCLTTPQVPPIDTQHIEPMESNVDANVLRQGTEDDEIKELV